LWEETPGLGGARTVTRAREAIPPRGR